MCLQWQVYWILLFYWRIHTIYAIMQRSTNEMATWSNELHWRPSSDGLVYFLGIYEICPERYVQRHNRPERKILCWRCFHTVSILLGDADFAMLEMGAVQRQSVAVCPFLPMCCHSPLSCCHTIMAWIIAKAWKLECALAGYAWTGFEHSLWLWHSIRAVSMRLLLIFATALFTIIMFTRAEAKHGD